MPDNQRLLDLVRYMRGELLRENLITNEEYAELAKDHPAVARLETYDGIRGRMVELQAALAKERQRAEKAEAVANHPAILDLLISAVGHFQEQGKATVANIYDDLRLRILKLNPVPAIKESDNAR